jgi:hypothetical protein
MEQEPVDAAVDTMVTVDPDTVHADVEDAENSTGSPEVAVAETTNGLLPDGTLSGALNAILCTF